MLTAAFFVGIKVPDWNQKTFVPEKIRIDDVGYRPDKFIQTTRLGIPVGRDEHLLYRFIDYDHASNCTSNPLTKSHYKEGVDYLICKYFEDD